MKDESASLEQAYLIHFSHLHLPMACLDLKIQIPEKNYTETIQA